MRYFFSLFNINLRYYIPLKINFNLQVLQHFDENVAKHRIGGKASEIDSYMNLPLRPRVPNENFDILNYWKEQLVSFPILARMARDILAIPITSVASESSFSMGGRILNKWRNCLSAPHVEVLITSKNWLDGYDEEEEEAEGN